MFPSILEDQISLREMATDEALPLEIERLNYDSVVETTRMCFLYKMVCNVHL